jgi:hypothetical protein
VRRSKKRRPVSEMGLVSRVSPVHTAMRNCTRDEGRSFEVGNQVLISSHRKLLLPKAMIGPEIGIKTMPQCTANVADGS